VVGAPSATALLQHGIQFLLPLKIVPPYTVSSATSSLTSWPSSLTINLLRPATWRLACACDSCLMLDYVRVINFLLFLLVIIK